MVAEESRPIIKACHDSILEIIFSMTNTTLPSYMKLFLPNSPFHLHNRVFWSSITPPLFYFSMNLVSNRECSDCQQGSRLRTGGVHSHLVFSQEHRMTKPNYVCSTTYTDLIYYLIPFSFLGRGNKSRSWGFHTWPHSLLKVRKASCKIIAMIYLF